MIRQLRFDLRHHASLAREDFVVSDSNAAAAGLIDAWPKWPGGVLVLVGPAGAGKSHLASAWAERAEAERVDPRLGLEGLAGREGRALLIEEAERAGDDLLFHAISMTAAGAGSLLLTSRLAPESWPHQLPDLKSRLAAAPVAPLGPPDDAVLGGVAEKLFRERLITPTDDLFPYIINRIERSIPALIEVIERLDEAASAQGRKVSRVLARELLEGEETGGAIAAPSGLGDKQGEP